MTLADRRMSTVMIRRVMQRLLSLVNAYIEHYSRCDQLGHHYRLSQLRQAFTLDEVLCSKKGGQLRSRTDLGRDF